ncbi:hypothetical protein [Dysosmobacter sp.]|uniref:hypothetical protein n=1 Tax=Dysosmobacter sp. TaxID=2591382 RepID=UPI003AB2FCDB
MTIETYASQQIRTLLPKCEKLEIELYIGDSDFSVDFFGTINGQRKQCLDFIDEGIISEKEYDKVAESIVNFVRNSEDFRPGKVNKYRFDAS